MKRSLLVVALLLAGVVVWFVLRKKPVDDPAPPQPGSAVAAGSSERPSGTPTVTPAPSLGSEARLPETGSAGSEYVVGDVRVRDHRAGSNAPMDIPPTVHALNTRSLPSTLTRAMAQKVQAVLTDCVKDVPTDARGEHPRLEGQVIVAIKDHKMSVTSATMQLRDMTDDAAAATKQCVETHTVGLDTPAADQDDIDNYSISVSFAVL